MHQLTVKKAINARDTPNRNEGGHYIYRYYEGDITFYVGRSIHPFTRLREHLGLEGRMPSPDAIGQLILDNRPVSLSWFVDIHSLQELAPDVDFSTLPIDLQGVYAQDLEDETIARYKPRLNVMNCQEHTPLPERYQSVPSYGPLKLPG